MHPNFWKGLLIVNVVMLVLLALSVPYVESTATFVVIQLSVAHIAVAMILISSFIYFDWDPLENLR